ncbi:MAG: chorismate mutase [Oscillospiraceae bacterium]|nr:chorismate mutase [Oscillospiraceae bacterium]
MEISDYRQQIDQVDQELLQLFYRRMEIAAQIGAYKREKGLPVLDATREREKLNRILAESPEGLGEYAVSLYSLIFELSRSCQNQILGTQTELTEQIRMAIETTPKLFPTAASVACQGVEGAYSQLACEKLFRHPNILYFNSFGSVFAAIESGLCRYGILPVENSTAGSVNAVYDLMMKHNFRIVRSVRLKVDHNLLVKPGTRLADIREIYSHEQAISQCAGFLQTLPGVKVIPCANTAVAAKMVAESEDGSKAALSSAVCMKLYGLQCLKEAVQDKENNYTRFVCISKELEIYPGADRTSLMMVLPHTPGSLYKVLSRFYALGLNLNKLESRPLPEKTFEFMFYFDLDTSVYSPQFIQLMGEMQTICDGFSYLGSYSEVI